MAEGAFSHAIDLRNDVAHAFDGVGHLGPALLHVRAKPEDGLRLEL